MTGAATKMAADEEKNWKENFKKFLLFKEILDKKNRTDVNVILDKLNAEEYNPNHHVPNQNVTHLSHFISCVFI